MAASSWVKRWAPLAGPGEVLDVACGSGRHARHFAALGHPVLAVDRDNAALAETVASSGAPAPITVMAFDLEDGSPWPFEPARFAAIVVTNYLYRPLFKRLAASLAPGGLLIYETFAMGNEQFGKPSNPNFLLAPGELLALASANGLQVLAFEDGRVDAPRPAMVQRLVAVAPGFARERAWLDAVPGVAPRDSGQE